MKNIIKIFSKLLDYVWFYLIAVFFLDLFEADLYLYIVTLALVPLFFIPIETVLLKCFRTTLGKILFGLRYETDMTWKKALALAWRSENLVQKRLKKLPYTLVIVLATALSALCIAPELPFKAKAGKEMFGGASKLDTEKWTKVTPANNIFSALFPKEPEFKEQTFPANSKNLLYSEYSLNDGLTFSLGHMDLPKSWTKWGSKRVFQGCYKLVAKQFSVQDKQSSSHDTFPAYEYKMSDANKQYLGKLVLVGNTLYRVEVSKAGGITNEDMPQAYAFFNSFHPR